MNDGLIHHVGLLPQCISIIVSQLSNYIPRPEFAGIIQKFRADITEVRSSLAEKFVMVVGKLTGLERRLQNVEQESRDKSLVIDRLRSRMDETEESQRGPRAQQAIESYNGNLLWKIESYQRKRQDAINGVNIALYSPPFYSAQFGYKMCAKIFLNGDGFREGTHLSLFFLVMRGEMITYYEEFCEGYLFDKLFDPLTSRAGNIQHFGNITLGNSD